MTEAPGVGQTKRSRTKMLPEDAILLPEIVDAIFLVASHPASQGQHEEMQSVGHGRRLQGSDTAVTHVVSGIHSPRPFSRTIRGRGRRCVTRVFLKPSVLVDLHVKGPAVLMAGPVRCASRRMSVSKHTSPLEPASGLDAPACAVMASPGHPCPSRIPNSLAECRAKATLRAADRVPYAVACMEAVVLTLLHLAVTAAKLCRPGGVRAVIAENLLLKQQLIVLRRPRKRAPNLTTVDRLLCGFGPSFSGRGGSERSPLASAPRHCWRFIGRWCIGSTGACSRRAIARGRPDRRGRATRSSGRSLSSNREIPGSAVHALHASSRGRSASTSTRTSSLACWRNTIDPPRAAPGRPGCRSSVTRRTVSGASTCFAASPSCSRATGCSWSWTSARGAWSASVYTAGRSTRPASAACSTPPLTGRGHRDISVRIMTRCSKPIAGRRIFGFWRLMRSRRCRTCLSHTPL